MPEVVEKINDKDFYANKIKNDLHQIIETIVDHPEKIEYKLFPLDTHLIIEIFAYDQSKFILGKQGSTMNHVRELTKIICRKYKKSPFVKVDVNVEYTGNKER